MGWLGCHTAGAERVAKHAASPGSRAEIFRLPSDVTPLRYRLQLEIIPEQSTFAGSVEIDINLRSRRREIYLHGFGLDVGRVYAIDAQGVSHHGVWSSRDREGTAAVIFSDVLGPGQVKLHIDYKAYFDRALMGNYRVNFDRHAYAFTQFEPTSARLAFPCFDEPRFKTPFSLTVTTHAKNAVVANTQVVHKAQLPQDKIRLRFEQTPPLPTYLVAWAVGPFDIFEGPEVAPNSVRSFPLRIRGFAPRGRGKQLAAALAQTPAILSALEEYLGSAHPFAKLDLIAVPDFDALAMENPGAIMFRDSLLLLADASNTEEQRREFANVMAHELAHQWFGNLVTMQWWDDLWLNESLATWLASRIVDKVYPHYQAMLDLQEDAYDAMHFDSFHASRKVKQPIRNLEDIQSAFDAITYLKGASVLRMVEHWVGEAELRNGIRSYLGHNRFKTATSEDFLKAVSSHTSKKASAVLQSFINQPGVPHFAVKMDCSGNQSRLRVEQSRFLPVGSGESSAVRWTVPFCFSYGQDTKTAHTCKLIDAEHTDIPVSGVCPKWLHPNTGGNGYYRWTLEREASATLAKDGWKALPTAERLAFADALRAAYLSAAQDVGDLLKQLSLLTLDSSRFVATSPIPTLKEMNLIVPMEGQANFRAYTQKLYNPVLERLGGFSAKDDQVDASKRLMKQDVTDFLGFVAQDETIVQNATALGWAYIRTQELTARQALVANDMIALVLTVTMQHDGPEFFEALMSELHRTQDATLRTNILQALGAAKQPELALAARELCLDKRLRGDERTLILQEQLARVSQQRAAWEWLKKHYDELALMLSFLDRTMLPWLTSHLCTQKEAREVFDFFTMNAQGSVAGSRALAGAVEAISLCAARKKVHGPGVARYFSN